MKKVRNTIQAAIKAARWIRLKQGKDVRAVGTNVVSSAANPHSLWSTRWLAYGLLLMGLALQRFSNDR